MITLQNALKKKNKAKKNKINYQNSEYRLTQKEQESLNIMWFLLALPILICLFLYAIN